MNWTQWIYICEHHEYVCGDAGIGIFGIGKMQTTVFSLVKEAY